MIPDSFLEELKYHSDLEQVIGSYLVLKRRGRNLVGLCPFHSEKTPSFTVYPENQSYYCFGCGAGGDVITFVRQVESLEYIEAVRFLAQRAGLAMPEDVAEDKTAKLKTRILEMNREAARFFHQCLTAPAGRLALEYLTGRGLTGKTIKNFGLGFAPEGWDTLRGHLQQKGFTQQEMLAAALVAQGRNGGTYDSFRSRVMFPIIDLRGNVIGFGGRTMGEKGPKYLNSSDTPVFKKSNNLYALNFAKATKADTLILAEGYMDVIAIHQGGFNNAVATLGTSLTEQQSRLISQYVKKVVIAYDSDGAGQAATRRAINLFDKTDVSVSVLEMQGAKDPDEYLKKFGPERFGMLIAGGKGAVRFEIDKLRRQHDLEMPEQKVAFLNEFCKLMAGMGNPLQREVYIGEIARELEIPREQLALTTANIIKKRQKAAARKDSHNLRVYAQDKTGIKANPQRSRNLSHAVAEDKLITLLLKNPDYFQYVSTRLTPEAFITQENRQVYELLAARAARSQPLELIYLSGGLDAGQMARLSQLLTSAASMRFTRDEADDYINVLLEQKKLKTTDEVAQMDDRQLQDYITSLTAKKK
ncbi:DNA primase [Oscillospiraceae bacterium MB08-C2-2]|nr:DNA primase [Oscillospiraceae bacterium MB08-C2-2]